MERLVRPVWKLEHFWVRHTETYQEMPWPPSKRIRSDVSPKMFGFHMALVSNATWFSINKKPHINLKLFSRVCWPFQSMLQALLFRKLINALPYGDDHRLLNDSLRSINNTQASYWNMHMNSIYIIIHTLQIISRHQEGLNWHEM